MQKDSKEQWRRVEDEECPVVVQDLWRRYQSTKGPERTDKDRDREMRFFLQRKEHASLILSEIISHHLSPQVGWLVGSSVGGSVGCILLV